MDSRMELKTPPPVCVLSTVPELPELTSLEKMANEGAVASLFASTALNPDGVDNVTEAASLMYTASSNPLATVTAVAVIGLALSVDTVPMAS